MHTTKSQGLKYQQNGITWSWSYLFTDFTIIAGDFKYAYVKKTVILYIGRLLANIGCSIFLLSGPLLVSGSFSSILAHFGVFYQTGQFLSQGLSLVSSILHKKKKKKSSNYNMYYNNMFVLFCFLFFSFQMGQQLLVLSIVAPAFLHVITFCTKMVILLKKNI